MGEDDSEETDSDYLCLTWLGSYGDSWPGSSNTGWNSYANPNGKYINTNTQKNGRDKYKHESHNYFINYDGDGAGGGYTFFKGSNESMFYTNTDYHIAPSESRNAITDYNWSQPNDYINIIESSQSSSCEHSLNFTATIGGSRSGGTNTTSGLNDFAVGNQNFTPTWMSGITGSGALSSGDLTLTLDYDTSLFPHLVVSVTAFNWDDMEINGRYRIPGSSESLGPWYGSVSTGLDQNSENVNLIPSTKTIDLSEVMPSLPTRTGAGIYTISVLVVNRPYGIPLMTLSQAPIFRYDL